MAKKTVDTEVYTGLEQETNVKEAEYDLVSALLEAADFKTSDDNILKVNIERGGKFLFAVHLHPLSEQDTQFANKQATLYMPNPQNKKLPKIKKDFDDKKFKSWLIYLATTEEDQEKIWGNPQLMKKKELAERWESVDVLLMAGEKSRMIEEIYKLSGFDKDEDGEESVDQETF